MKKYFGEGTTLRNRTPLPAHLMGMLDSWQAMVLLSRPEYKSILRSARRGNEPESIRRLETLVNRNLGFTPFQELEKTKIILTSEATAFVELQADGLGLQELITRPQFERLIADYVAQVDESIDEVLKQSGLKADQIKAVLRTGGTAEIPTFVRLLTNKFGCDRLRKMSPFETIVGGLAIRAGEVAESH